MISTNQRGSPIRRSYTTNIIHFLDEVTTKLDATERKEVSYFHFREAFVSINYNLLIKKLQDCEIAQSLVRQIGEF